MSDDVGGKVAYELNKDWLHPDLEGLPMWELSESDHLYQRN